MLRGHFTNTANDAYRHIVLMVCTTLIEHSQSPNKWNWHNNQTWTKLMIWTSFIKLDLTKISFANKGFLVDEKVDTPQWLSCDRTTCNTRMSFRIRLNWFACATCYLQNEYNAANFDEMNKNSRLNLQDWYWKSEVTMTETRSAIGCKYMPRKHKLFTIIRSMKTNRTLTHFENVEQTITRLQFES